MKFYQFSLAAVEAEAMWDFSQHNQVNFNFIRQTDLNPIEDPLEAALKRRYIYGGYMSEETYLMFRLIVPGVMTDDPHEYP
jgi:hypothetical protein